VLMGSHSVPPCLGEVRVNLTDIKYTLKRSDRKTVAIHIRDGLVEVRAPYGTSVGNIEKFIAAKERWISEKLAHSRARFEKKENFELDYGDSLLYRGSEYLLRAQQGKQIGFDENGFFIPPDLSADNIKAAVVRIYRLLAKQALSEKVSSFAEKMGLHPNNIKINSAKTRWGSCSSKSNLNFSWMLMMADDDVIDYIVVHELAHLKEMNHSPLFWDIVERHAPDYKECKSRLKLLQLRLNEENWEI